MLIMLILLILLQVIFILSVMALFIQYGIWLVCMSIEELSFKTKKQALKELIPGYIFCKCVKYVIQQWNKLE